MHNHKHLHSTRDVIQYVLPYIRGRVLDAGGGPGAKYRSLISSVADEYVCLDAKPGGHVSVVGDVTAMPFGDESFDTIVCNQVLEHVSDPERVIAEAYRVLRPGGHLVCTAPFLEPIHADPGDFFRYTKEGLVSLVQRNQFRIVESGVYGGFWVVLSSLVKFTAFDPYRPLSSFRRRLFRFVDRAAMWLDRFVIPSRIYSDSFVIAMKEL